MKYQKIINLLDNTTNQPSKFETKNWIEINDELRGTYNINGQIKFKTSILRSRLCDYSDAYITVKGTIAVPNNGTAAAPNKRNKEVVFKNCAPFTDCASEINNTRLDNAKDIDVVMNMYNLIEYSENYSQTSGSLWLYYRDQSALDGNGNITDFPVKDDTHFSFAYKKNVIGRTGDDRTKNTKIWVPLKYLSSFWRTLEMPLVNCEINHILTWSESCVLISGSINIKYQNLQQMIQDFMLQL